MNRNAIIALGVFGVLLVLVLVTREDRVKVGVKELALPTVQKDDVTKIESTWKSGDDKRASVVLEKKDGAFQVFDPQKESERFPVDEAPLKAALDAIPELRAESFITNKKERHAEYEIDDAKGQVVKVFTQKGVVLDLVFGKFATGGGNYVREAGSDDVYLAKGRLAPALKKEAAQWRKRALFSTKPEELASLAIKHKDKTVLVLQSEPPATPPPDENKDPEKDPAEPPKPPEKATWKLAADTQMPKGFRVDADALSRVATSFATLRAQDFAAPTITDETAGLTGDHTVVEATTHKGEKVVLHLGNEDDKKKVYAKVDGDAQIYLLGSYQAKQLAKHLDEMRDLSLLSFKPEDAEKVTFRSNGTTVVVAKKEGAWALVEPKTAPAGSEFDASTVQGQLQSLSRLRASRYVKDAASPTETGFDKAAVTVEVTAAGQKPQIVRFGKKAPPVEGVAESNDIYVQGSVDSLVYAVGPFPKQRYEKPFELFKKPPPPPPGGGGMQGLESLPPDVRKKIEAQMKQGGMGT